MTAKTSKHLDEKAHARFQQRLKLLGINAADVPGEVTIGGAAAKGERQTGLYSRVVVVKSLAELKTIGGVPDEDFTERGHSDRHLVYPQSSPDVNRRLSAAKGDANALARLMTDDDRTMLDDAARAYLLGNSTKVDPALVDLINARDFPMEVTVTAGQDIKITGEYVLGANGPESLDAVTITMEPGGYIVCKNKVAITTDVLTRVSN